MPLPGSPGMAGRGVRAAVVGGERRNAAIEGGQQARDQGARGGLHGGKAGGERRRGELAGYIGPGRGLGRELAVERRVEGGGLRGARPSFGSARRRQRLGERLEFLLG